MAYQASLVKPSFIFWQDAVKPKYPWQDQMSLYVAERNQKGMIRYMYFCEYDTIAISGQ